MSPDGSVSVERTAGSIARTGDHPRLTDIQQIAQLGSWEWDTTSDTMLWSSEMYRIIGRSETEVRPSFEALVESIHPDDRGFVERRFSEMLETPSCMELEYRVVQPDGRIRSVLTRAEVLPSDSDHSLHLIGTAQDVTEMRRYATALTSQVEQLQQITQASVAIYAADGVEEILETATAHALRIVGARSARASIIDPAVPGESLVHLSYDGEQEPSPVNLLPVLEPLGESFLLRRGEVEDHPAFAEAGENVIRHAHPGVLIVPLVDVLGGASGAIQLFEKRRGDFSEGDEAVALQIAQITSLAIQKARLFQELHASEDRYRRLFEAHLSGDFVASPNGEFVDANPALAGILGYNTVSGLKSVRLGEVFRSERESRRLIERIRKEGRALQYETEFLRADQSSIFVIINLVGVFNREGELVAVQGCLFDVTEWKLAEEALLESKQQLLQAQKMEAVGQLAGGIAHDFNNMLMAIQGFTNLLEEELPAFSSSQSHVKEIRKAADRSARLTRQLLAYSRKQVLQPEVMELNEIVAGMEDMLRRLIGEHIVYVNLLDPIAGRVHTDPGQLQQVLMNLVLNARDAMPEGGQLTVRTGVSSYLTDQKLEGFVLPAGDWAKLVVSDNGCGMPTSVLTRVFEPFFTTKPVGSGSGLGLSTVYGIVKQSGGYIQAQSVVDEGTTFTIYLPQTTQVAARTEIKGRENPETGGSATILLAEDEAVLRSLGALVLRRAGYRVLEAEDGMEALRIAEAEGYRIDVLVTDLVMPRLGGEDLATRLLEKRPELQVVFMSGYAEEVVARGGTVAAGSQFLEKPFSPHVLASAVRDALPANAKGQANSAA